MWNVVVLMRAKRDVTIGHLGAVLRGGGSRLMAGERGITGGGPRGGTGLATRSTMTIRREDMRQGPPVARPGPPGSRNGGDPSLGREEERSGGKPIECILGIVLAVDRAAGTLTLRLVRGRSLCCTADPALLRDVQIGGPVQVVVEGTTVRTLRCL
jgi:hypothetical protein